MNVAGVGKTLEKLSSNPIPIASERTHESEDKMMKRGLMKVSHLIFTSDHLSVDPL